MNGRNLAIDVKVGEHHTWHLFGVTLNGDTISATLIAGLIILLLGMLLRRSISAREPGRVQLFFEALSLGDIGNHVNNALNQAGAVE